MSSYFAELGTSVSDSANSAVSTKPSITADFLASFVLQDEIDEPDAKKNVKKDQLKTQVPPWLHTSQGM